MTKEVQVPRFCGSVKH